jgi:hypothetical protein
MKECDDLRYVTRSVTDLINAFPGNNSVNAVQHATIDESVFSLSFSPRPVLTDKSTRSLTLDTRFLYGLPCKNRGVVFSVRGPCREDMREYGNGNCLHSVWRQSNSSTVTLLVVGGDKKESLKSETVKYGREYHGTRTRE